MDAKDFGRRLMYQWALDGPSQREFDQHAKVLVDRFSGSGAGVTKGARVDFRNYIDFLRVSEGLDVAFSRLDELRKSGLSSDLYATAGMTAARRAGEYGRAADFLLAAHEEWPKNMGIFVFLIETLISADRVTHAAELLREANRSGSMGIRSSAVGLKLGEMAAVCGVWDEVEQFVHSSVAEPDAPAVKVLMKRAELGLSFRDQAAEFPTYVLNMLEDRRKLSLLRGLYRQFGVVPNRHEAVDGRRIDPSELPDIAAHRGLRMGKGALGCALGHISMWQTFLLSNRSYGFFLEDDGLPYTWMNLSEVVAEAGQFDVLYVNERMSSVKAGIVSTSISPLWETLATRPDSVHGWGADGYILSRLGAERLLEAASEDKVLSHIDGQIASYGIPPDATPTNVAQQIGLSVRQTSRYLPTLNIKCLEFPLVASMDFGDSTIGRVGGH
ncbi:MULTISPECIES: glycosyltransferase family 25 protein [unclassified Arthrobacter]|uniref:glycosyltransferase family 25 protein n=1 Tax=unclassified Arthrobacter TaxID=235627 RepID=UPI0014932929|nr:MULTISPECIES: glycosyltransferase family 25 protein [unclassified Arthrobacter]NOJ64183.1 glycosyltransferase family 25 protein [Arthrobacter sp. 147(2020)]